MTTALGSLWVVFDNLHALGKVDERFHFRDDKNKLVGVAGEDSQFEVREAWRQMITAIACGKCVT